MERGGEISDVVRRETSAPCMHARLYHRDRHMSRSASMHRSGSSCQIAVKLKGHPRARRPALARYFLFSENSQNHRDETETDRITRYRLRDPSEFSALVRRVLGALAEFELHASSRARSEARSIWASGTAGPFPLRVRAAAARGFSERDRGGTGLLSSEGRLLSTTAHTASAPTVPSSAPTTPAARRKEES